VNADVLSPARYPHRRRSPADRRCSGKCSRQCSPQCCSSSLDQSTHSRAADALETGCQSCWLDDDDGVDADADVCVSQAMMASVAYCCCCSTAAAAVVVAAADSLDMVVVFAAEESI